MDNESSPLQIGMAFLGCMFVFLIPIFGILIIWDFDLSNLTRSLNNPDGNLNEEDYDFAIEPGEDAILTTEVEIYENEQLITQKSNPAVFFKIDSAQIEGAILYGHNGEELLRQGFWHLPGSVDPGEKGISAIFGHRRHHLPPAKDTFYNLDKVHSGDRVEIKLEDGTWLEYTVTDITIINPDQILEETTKETDEYLVKFLTCTPLGTDKQRLVVTATKTF